MPLLDQIESFDDETSIFPNYYPATGDLITAGSVSGGLNNCEASIFDVSGLSSVQVSFMNGSYGSGVIVAIALPVPCGDICPCPGDLDGDQDVDGWDLADFSYYFNQQLSEADLNADNIFDITDIEIFTADYGRNDCPPSCDDDNACTEESCDPVTGCMSEPVDCDDDNACTEDFCDPVTGCQHIPICCDDNNACTIDTCDPVTGCRHDNICH